MERLRLGRNKPGDEFEERGDCEGDLVPLGTEGRHCGGSW